eukprot:2437029-Rhodomonas_salina.1
MGCGTTIAQLCTPHHRRSQYTPSQKNKTTIAYLRDTRVPQCTPPWPLSVYPTIALSQDHTVAYPQHSAAESNAFPPQPHNAFVSAAARALASAILSLSLSLSLSVSVPGVPSRLGPPMVLLCSDSDGDAAPAAPPGGGGRRRKEAEGRERRRKKEMGRKEKGERQRRKEKEEMEEEEVGRKGEETRTRGDRRRRSGG